MQGLQENQWVKVEFYARLFEGEALDVTKLSSDIRSALESEAVFLDVQYLSFSIETDSQYYGKRD